MGFLFISKHLWLLEKIKEQQVMIFILESSRGPYILLFAKEERKNYGKLSTAKVTSKGVRGGYGGAYL
jgi:hypothetical protein